MTSLSKDTAQNICKALRSGTVPNSGLEHYAVGLDAQMKELRDNMDYVGRGHSEFKFIRGAYGSGKTFLCSLAAADAVQKGFVVSKVVISNADTPLYKLEEVYRKLCSGLTVRSSSGAFAQIIDSWLYQLGDQVVDLDGISDDSPEFFDAVDRRVDQFLQKVSEKAGSFASCLKTYHRLQADGKYQEAQSLLDWLGGNSHVSYEVKKLAYIKGNLERNDALEFMAALLELIKQAGYRGLVLVLDEVETNLRQRGPERKKGLEILRQLVDAAGDNKMPGLYLLVTGTPDFFESPKGVSEEPALDGRIKVDFEDGKPENLRRPQIQLPKFDETRLKLVAKKVREIFPADHPNRVQEKVDDQFVEQLVDHFTDAFGGRVSVTPRVFLREFIDVMDVVDQHPDYDPRESYEFSADKLPVDDFTDEEKEFFGQEVHF